MTINSVSEIKGISEYQIGLRKVGSEYKSVGDYLDRAFVKQSDMSSVITVPLGASSILITPTQFTDITTICLDKTQSIGEADIYAVAAVSGVIWGTANLTDVQLQAQVEEYMGKLLNVGRVYDAAGDALSVSGNTIYACIMAEDTATHEDVFTASNVKAHFFYIDGSGLAQPQILDGAATTDIKLAIPYITKPRYLPIFSPEDDMVDPNATSGTGEYKGYYLTITAEILAGAVVDITTPTGATTQELGGGIDFVINSNADLKADAFIHVIINGVEVNDYRSIVAGGEIDLAAGTIAFAYNLYPGDYVKIIQYQ